MFQKQEMHEYKKQETCNKKDMQCFLGTVNYYRRFNPQYSQHSTNLTAIATRKTAPDKIDWTDDYMCGFKYLILNISVPSDQFVVQTDASGFSIGGVLNVCRQRQ